MFHTLPAVDHSRVKLESTENDYINASLVVMEEAQRSYILTQASPSRFSFSFPFKSSKHRIMCKQVMFCDGKRVMTLIYPNC